MKTANATLGNIPIYLSPERIKKVLFIQSLLEKSDMNLTDYINQTDPIRNPKVMLQNGEFKLCESIKSGLDTLTRVVINFPDDKNWTGEYVRKNNEANLMVADSDGNPKKYSCFYIPKK